MNKTTGLALLVALVGANFFPPNVARPAGQGAGKPPAKADALKIGWDGNWANVDKQTRGLTRMTIVRGSTGWILTTWASGGGGTTEIDQGSATLHLLGDDVEDASRKYGFASWDHGFKETKLTIQAEKDRLIVETYDLFKDHSGRSNYRSKYEFRKAQ